MDWLELGLGMVRTTRRLKIHSLLRSRTISEYLNSHEVRKLQVGAGSNILDGWLNADIFPTSNRVIFLDARNRFPFKDGTFHYVFSEHQIEHMTYKEASSMLRECHRVLRPGGKIRVATPSLEAMIALFTPDKTPLQQAYVKRIVDSQYPEIRIYSECFVINNTFKNYGHRFIYDRPTLQSALEKTGFIDVTAFTPGVSDDGALTGIEGHGRGGNENSNRYETMILQARRPI